MDKSAARLAVLERALTHVPFDGWTEPVLARAAEEAGYTREDVARFYPGGPIEALTLFVAQADARMAADYRAMTPPARIRDRIARLIRLRLEAYTPYKEAIRRGLALYAMPHHAPEGIRTLARTVDALWRAAGDTSTDFSWYTRRLLLSGVYMSTLLTWLNDASEGHARSWEFLERRIDDVMRIQTLKARRRSASPPHMPQ